jgi:hypothetical protein
VELWHPRGSHHCAAGEGKRDSPSLLTLSRARVPIRLVVVEELHSQQLRAGAYGESLDPAVPCTEVSSTGVHDLRALARCSQLRELVSGHAVPELRFWVSHGHAVVSCGISGA